MPWVPKEKEGAAPADEAPAKRDKSEGKSGKGKGGDKGDKKGQSKGDREGGDKGGKKGKGKDSGKDWGKDSGYGWNDGPPGGKKGDGKKGKDGGKKGKQDDFGPPKGGGGGKGGKGKFEDEGKGGSKGGKKGPSKGGGRARADSDEPGPRERPLRSEDMRRQATAHSGKHCQVRKHSSMGCAVVTLESVQVRQAILHAAQANDLKAEIAGRTVTMKPHAEKDTNADIPTDIFVGWGRQNEKNNPLPEQDLADYFDACVNEFQMTGRIMPQSGVPPHSRTPGAGMTEEEKRMQAQKTAAAQAQWAAGGGQLPAGARPGMPPPAPGAAPGAPGSLQAQQQQQAQYMQQLQAQMYLRYQQQQQYQQQLYLQQVQQQQQQQAYMAHLKAQQEAQAAQQRNRKAGYKASYRVPTDDEVQATLQKLARKPAGSEPASPEKEGEAAPDDGAADAAPAEASA